MNLQYNSLTQCTVAFLHWVIQVILKLFCLKFGLYSFTQFFIITKTISGSPFLQVKVSVVNSVGGSFCWNYATDTFYSNYAGANVRIMQVLRFYCIYVGDTFCYNYVIGSFCCNSAGGCFCCNYAVRCFCGIYTGESFCSKYVGDNFYWNYTGISVPTMQVVSAVHYSYYYFYCNYTGDCFCCSYVCDSFK